MWDTATVVADTLVVYLHYQLPASIPSFNFQYSSSLEVHYLDNSLADQPACLDFPYTALPLPLYSDKNNYHLSVSGCADWTTCNCCGNLAICCVNVSIYYVNIFFCANRVVVFNSNTPFFCTLCLSYCA